MVTLLVTEVFVTIFFGVTIFVTMSLGAKSLFEALSVLELLANQGIVSETS